MDLFRRRGISRGGRRSVVFVGIELVSEVLNSWVFYGLVVLTFIVLPDIRERNAQRLSEIVHRFKDTARIVETGSRCRRSTSTVWRDDELHTFDVDCCPTNGVTRCYVSSRLKKVKW